MADDPQAALSVVRNKLQVILLRADLQQNSANCNSCAVAVSEIISEIRALEAFIVEAMRK